ncbi:MAG: four-carbon acid sugar kinase family protein [Clostridiales bacterium]|nr:four-carbon acid sugar kinase family protein [Clostridiales bacterium]
MRKMGCIADDFTGASDAASFLRSQGMKTVLYNEIPEGMLDEDCDAVVIALKTRTAPVQEAVEQSMQALDWLKAQGAPQLYVKYCSTFDSTKEGNIGPILDAALEKWDLPYTVLCPSLPVNGRTVRDGSLYVFGVPLHETHMKNHPLTPMWDADISVLMREQSKYPCVRISAEELRAGRALVLEKLEAVRADSGHFYVIPDYYEDIHGEWIYSCFGMLPLLSGGSGLLGNHYLHTESSEEEEVQSEEAAGKSLLLAGSCSKATLEQIEKYKQTGNPTRRIDPWKLMNGEETAESIWRELEGKDGVLFYSSDKAENVRENQKEGKERVAEILEQTMAALARLAVRDGYTQVIVAGGETSGAVTKGLGYGSYLIGESIAPGVPVMTPMEDRKIRLVLKSGNFGQPEFFERAVEMTSTGKRGR